MLTPDTIYKFYYLAYVKTNPQPESNPNIDRFVDYELEPIKQIYLESFLQIIKNQLIKYLERDRLDKGAFTRDQVLKSTNYRDLDKFMQATYRSDMLQRNDRWNMLTGFLIKLQNATDTEDIIFLIDRINNCTHNTRTNENEFESILVKFPKEIKQAFDFCNEASPEMLRKKVPSLEYLTENKIKNISNIIEDININNGLPTSKPVAIQEIAKILDKEILTESVTGVYVYPNDPIRQTADFYAITLMHYEYHKLSQTSDFLAASKKEMSGVSLEEFGQAIDYAYKTIIKEMRDDLIWKLRYCCWSELHYAISRDIPLSGKEREIIEKYISVHTKSNPVVWPPKHIKEMSGVEDIAYAVFSRTKQYLYCPACNNFYLGGHNVICNFCGKKPKFIPAEQTTSIEQKPEQTTEQLKGILKCQNCGKERPIHHHCDNKLKYVSINAWCPPGCKDGEIVERCGYGGPKWAAIAKAIPLLLEVKDDEETFTAIDHAIDLVHNTGPALNKIEGYDNNYKNFLDYKRYHHPAEYAPCCSEDVQDMLRYFYAGEGHKTTVNLPDKYKHKHPNWKHEISAGKYEEVSGKEFEDIAPKLKPLNYEDKPPIALQITVDVLQSSNQSKKYLIKSKQTDDKSKISNILKNEFKKLSDAISGQSIRAIYFGISTTIYTGPAKIPQKFHNAMILTQNYLTGKYTAPISQTIKTALFKEMQQIAKDSNLHADFDTGFFPNTKKCPDCGEIINPANDSCDCGTKLELGKVKKPEIKKSEIKKSEIEEPKTEKTSGVKLLRWTRLEAQDEMHWTKFYQNDIKITIEKLNKSDIGLGSVYSLIIGSSIDISSILKSEKTPLAAYSSITGTAYAYYYSNATEYFSTLENAKNRADNYATTIIKKLEMNKPTETSELEEGKWTSYGLSSLIKTWRRHDIILIRVELYLDNDNTIIGRILSTYKEWPGGINAKQEIEYGGYYKYSEHFAKLDKTYLYGLQSELSQPDNEKLNNAKNIVETIAKELIELNKKEPKIKEQPDKPKENGLWTNNDGTEWTKFYSGSGNIKVGIYPPHYCIITSDTDISKVLPKYYVKQDVNVPCEFDNKFNYRYTPSEWSVNRIKKEIDELVKAAKEYINELSIGQKTNGDNQHPGWNTIEPGLWMKEYWPTIDMTATISLPAHSKIYKLSITTHLKNVSANFHKPVGPSNLEPDEKLAIHNFASFEMAASASDDIAKGLAKLNPTWNSAKWTEEKANDTIIYSRKCPDGIVITITQSTSNINLSVEIDISKWQAPTELNFMQAIPSWQILTKNYNSVEEIDKVKADADIILSKLKPKQDVKSAIEKEFNMKSKEELKEIDVLSTSGKDKLPETKSSETSKPKKFNMDDYVEYMAKFGYKFIPNAILYAKNQNNVYCSIQCVLEHYSATNKFEVSLITSTKYYDLPDDWDKTANDDGTWAGTIIKTFDDIFEAVGWVETTINGLKTTSKPPEIDMGHYVEYMTELGYKFTPNKRHPQYGYYDKHYNKIYCIISSHEQNPLEYDLTAMLVVNIDDYDVPNNWTKTDKGDHMIIKKTSNYMDEVVEWAEATIKTLISKHKKQKPGSNIALDA